MNKIYVAGILFCLLTGFLIQEFTEDIWKSIILIVAVYSAILGSTLIVIGSKK